MSSQPPRTDSRRCSTAAHVFLHGADGEHQVLCAPSLLYMLYRTIQLRNFRNAVLRSPIRMPCYQGNTEVSELASGVFSPRLAIPLGAAPASPGAAFSQARFLAANQFHTTITALPACRRAGKEGGSFAAADRIIKEAFCGCVFPAKILIWAIAFALFLLPSKSAGGARGCVIDFSKYMAGSDVCRT